MSRLKVCVCTSYAGSAEPRAPRHTAHLAKTNEEGDFVFLDCVPQGQQRIVPTVFSKVRNLEYKTHFFPHRKSGVVSLLLGKIRTSISRKLFVTTGFLYSSSLSISAAPLERFLEEINADIYIGYNIDTFLPIYKTAKKLGASIVFDCMEFYSEMGEGQTDLDRKIIKEIESKCLPSCELVFTSSSHIASELMKTYGIKNLLPIYNVPPIEAELPQIGEKDDRFTLYWRNSTIGLGQRGLGDLLAALKLLPKEIDLHIQGRLSSDQELVLRQYINELGLTERIFIHPPYLPDEAVVVASKYTIGLCPERGGCLNQELTVSNKIFDYMMAGLPVIASDLPGLRDVITRSKAGLLFETGQASDLARKIASLYDDRELLEHLSANARAFALSQGNLAYEMKKIESAFSSVIATRKMRRVRTLTG